MLLSVTCDGFTYLRRDGRIYRLTHDTTMELANTEPYFHKLFDRLDAVEGLQKTVSNAEQKAAESENMP